MIAQVLKTAGFMAGGLMLTVTVTQVLAQSGASNRNRQVEPATMTRDETQLVLENYLVELVNNGSYAEYFADDIVLTLMDKGDVVEGHQAVTDTVRFLHEIAFDAAPEVETIVYGEAIASAEIVFSATHTDAFDGIPATGAQIRVPYSVVWQLENGKITDLRVYQLASGLSAALTAAPAN